MKPRVNPSPALLQLAGAQGGALSLEQAVGHGLGRRSVTRLVDQGEWQRLAPGLYLTRRGERPWLGLAWAGVLLGGQSAYLSGQAAGFLWGLVVQPDTIAVGLPAGVGRTAPAPWRFEQHRSGVRLPAVGEPPRLSPADTVLDLCQGATETEVIDLVTTAVQRRTTRPAALRRRLAERRRVAHRSLLLAVLEDAAAGTESPLEVRYLHDVERAHHLPGARRQYRSVSGHVRDAYYEEYGTLVELDGRLGHEDMGRFRDMERDNWATAQGLVTLRFGSRDVLGRPCIVARQVAAALQRGGWAGALTRCRRCRRVPDK